MAQNTSARALPLGVGLVAVLIAAAALVAMFVAQGYVEDERERALRAWQDRLALVADSRAEALVGWLDEQNAVLAGLAGNTALQLYLTELAASGGDRTQVTEEAAQAVYLRNLLIVVEHRDRLSRFGFEMLEAALYASGKRLVVVEEGEVTDDLVRDLLEILTSACGRLYGRRSARNRARRALEVMGCG